MTAAGQDTNLGLWGSESREIVERRWARFLGRWGGKFSGVAISRQVHGNEVGIVRLKRGLSVLPDRDGHVTAESGMLLAVTVADCVPIFLVEPGSGAVCLLHSGWKGTAAGILEQGVQRLMDVAECDVENIVMHCGVSVCGSCYEVNSEVASRVTGRPHRGKTQLDLRNEICKQARSLGVGAMSVSTHCTVHDRDSFFSHRGSAGSLNRMAAFLGFPQLDPP